MTPHVIKPTLAAALVGFVIAASACHYDPNETTTLYLPDYEIYKTQVHQFMNQQCGTLDCHGQVGRPLRIYGARGLRLFSDEAKLTPGGKPTEEAEYRDTYESIIGLEPEATRRVIACEQDPGTLLLLRKPSGYGPREQRDNGEGESHKGGRVTAAGAAGYACLYGWLTAGCSADGFGAAARQDCADAALLP